MSTNDGTTSPGSPIPAAPPRRRSETGQPGRFLPGAVVAGRYRMIGLIGRGGMGEVYRADDMKIGQQVALKFLPLDVERDPERLDRFLTEVRMSLRVTHPNVCRVFDIGQIDDRQYLSMEYVDGEDLASLLRRIGRLPEDKAVEIARQLCAGLAAAHDEGVLHRDLKPANIMIDGRGRAKIADFGLAGATEGISGGEARVGTPQYMAPEQVAGASLSERTDIYSLGLVLYELFTGKRAYEITSVDDARRLSTSAPTSPSSHVSGLNPLVERAILRCLESDPAKRPSSAAALAAALPGGDPLAMAIAAGDTPSPEMVAAAGSDAGLRPAVAWPLLGVALAGAVLFAFFAGRVVVQRAGAPLKSPDVLTERAREILRNIGLSGTAQDDAWGLNEDVGYLLHTEARRPTNALDTREARVMTFWYRESPIPFERLGFALPPTDSQRVGRNDPRMEFSGETRVVLDREGRLVTLEAVPSQKRTAGSKAAGVDWSVLFRAAGLEPAAWSPAEPEWTPSAFADQRAAWVPKDPGASSAVRVEAASFEGRPISFALVFPWTRPERIVTTSLAPGERAAFLVLIVLFCGIVFGSVFVARRNLRLDRCDRRGAARLAIFIGVVEMLVWLIDEHHVFAIFELYLFVMAAGWMLFVAALVSVFYLALEPYVRRTWPTILMSWSRIMAGKIVDPLVARDVLIGCAGGAVLGGLDLATVFLSKAVSGVWPRYLANTRPFLGPRHAVSALGAELVGSIFFALASLFILFVLRALLRREWPAIVAAAVVLSIPAAVAFVPFAVVPLLLALQLVTFFLLARAGLVAMITVAFWLAVLYMFPFSLPANMWYSGMGFVGVTVFWAVAITAFRIATGRPARTVRAAA